MPELPDVTVYRERLEALVKDRPLLGVRLKSPFLLRTVEPALDELAGLSLRAVERLGKRLVFAFEGDLFLVLHLMIAGRLRRYDPGKRIGGKIDLAAFDFEEHTFVLTEAGSKKRAALHAVRGRDGLAEFDRGGLEVLDSSAAEFDAALRRENRTIKRALCDPRLFSGIGNAYSDEILHRARLSPALLTSRFTPEQSARLRDAIVTVMQHWTDELRNDVGDGFPDRVTAFREGMAVHGRYGKPCPECGKPVQRIRYADNECNYCAECQCDGKLLADRGLSALLKKDWPRTLAELEERRAAGT